MKTYKLSKNLVGKSKNAFMLALELYNKPTIGYRAESFSILFSNAWELLLKAYIFKAEKGRRLSIFRKKQKNKRRESISLDECLNRVFENANNPVKRNIIYISDIRNEASHLIVKELDPYFSRVFQAGVINYIKFLSKWFGVDLNEDLNPGLVSLISDKDQIADSKNLRLKYNKADLKDILNWVDRFNKLSSLGVEATLSIKHTIAIVRNTKKADIVISSGKGNEQNAVIIEKTKNPDVTHPFTQSSAITQINKRIPKEMRFTTYNFQSFIFVHGYKKSNNDYFYKSKLSNTSQYSQKLIDEIVESINKDINNLKRWGKQYRQYLRSRKKILLRFNFSRYIL